MRDYYPLVARAVSRLEQNTPGAREALFDRLRLVLIDQLRIRQPPASIDEILRERAALEAAVRKIQPNLSTPIRSQTLPPHALDMVRDGGNASSRAVETSAPMCAPRYGLSHSDRSVVDAPAVRTDDLAGRPRFAAEGQRTDLLDAVLAEARAIFIAPPRVQHRPGSSSKIAPDPATIEVKPEIGGGVAPAESAQFLPPKYPDSKNEQAGRRNDPPREATNGAPINHLTSSAHSTILDNLTGIQLLDRLILDSSHPLAPDNLKQDTETVLQWLGASAAKAMKVEHYDRFGRAIRMHLAKGSTLSPRSSAGSMRSLDPVLTEELSRVFDRLLDEQQSAIVFDEALTWFAVIWIKLIVALNLIVIVALLASASAPLGAIAYLAKTYSPVNAWTWIAELVALSPALGAIAWRDRRLTGSWDATLITFIVSLRERLSRQTLTPHVTEKPTSFRNNPHRAKLNPRAVERR